MKGIRNRRHFNPFQLSIAPMIDVIFLLLIFFISSSKIVGMYSAIKVKDTPSSKFVSQLDDEVVISVFADKTILVDDLKTNINSLPSILKRKSKERQKAVIVSNNSIDIGFIVSLIGIAKSSGFTEVNIGATKDVN